MDDLDKVRLMAELEEEFCELNHGPYASRYDYPAVDYLVIPMGYKKNRVETVTTHELIIPICLECARALIGNEWTLLLCLDCSASRWICRKLAKNSYRHHLLFLKGCPDCTALFGGLYFADNQQMLPKTPYLMDRQKETVIA